MRREVCFLIGRDGAVLWSDASDSPTGLPDSRSRWEAIWRLRDELEEIAHSHPIGPVAFSEEDETTMSALSSALGRTVRFSVVAPTGLLVRENEREAVVEEEPWWAALLRLASGMTAEEARPAAGTSAERGEPASDRTAEQAEEEQ